MVCFERDAGHSLFLMN